MENKKEKYNVYIAWINYAGEELGKELIAIFYSENRAKSYVESEQGYMIEKGSYQVKISYEKA